jgi:hypothetical protein
MPTFLEQHALVNNSDFRTKCQMAAIKVATAVLADPARTAEHAYCRLILRQPTENYWIDQMAYAVISNPAMTADSTDSDFEYTVTTQFENLATEANNNL